MGLSSLPFSQNQTRSEHKTTSGHSQQTCSEADNNCNC